VTSARYGMTVPFDDVPLHAQAERYRMLADSGYTDLWSSEANGYDGLTPLVLGSVWAPTMRLGTAILPAYTRGPACLAQSAAALADAAPGRVAIGIGASSDVIVERWNGMAFDEPYKRVRDVLRFLRRALAGEKVVERYDTFAVDGFRIAHAPAEAPKLLVAGLREGMLRLAGREGDGAIINWLSAEDVATVAPIVQAAGGGAAKEVVARIFVCPSTDADAVRAMGRSMVTAYLNVPVYAAFHEWLGRGELLAPMWAAWKAGDRKAALAAVPDEVVDAVLVHGSPAACREQIARYVDNGVTTPVLTVLRGPGVDVAQACVDLGPGAA
jgi:probable F420-dependent oxidoreductase